MGCAAQRRDERGVARGDNGATAWAEHVERLGVGAFPYIVKHEQDGLVFEQLVKLALALRLIIEMTGIAEGLRHAALEGHKRRLLADADPEHAVGKRPPHLVVARIADAKTDLPIPPMP